MTSSEATSQVDKHVSNTSSVRVVLPGKPDNEVWNIVSHSKYMGGMGCAFASLRVWFSLYQTIVSSNYYNNYVHVHVQVKLDEITDTFSVLPRGLRCQGALRLTNTLSTEHYAL